MAPYIGAALVHLVLAGSAGAFGFFLFEDKATRAMFLAGAGAVLGVLALVLTFVRRRQCSLASRIYTSYRASPVVTGLIRFLILLLLVYAAASVYLTLAFFNLVPVPGPLADKPLQLFGESAFPKQQLEAAGAAVGSGMVPTSSTPTPSAGNRVGSTTATATRGAVLPTGTSRVSSPRLSAAPPIIAQSLLAAADLAPSSSTSPSSPPTATAGAAARQNRTATTNGAAPNRPQQQQQKQKQQQLGTMSATPTGPANPLLLLKLLAISQGAMGLLALAALVALPKPLDRVGFEPSDSTRATQPAAPAMGIAPTKADFGPSDAYGGGVQLIAVADSKPEGAATGKQDDFVDFAPPALRFDRETVPSFGTPSGVPGGASYMASGNGGPGLANPAAYGYGSPAFGRPQQPAPGPPSSSRFVNASPRLAPASAAYRGGAPPPPPSQPASQRLAPLSPASSSDYDPYNQHSRSTPTHSSGSGNGGSRFTSPMQTPRATFMSGQLYAESVDPYDPSTYPRGSLPSQSGGPVGGYASDTLRSGFSLRNLNPNSVPSLAAGRGRLGSASNGGVAGPQMPASPARAARYDQVMPKRDMARTMYLTDEEDEEDVDPRHRQRQQQQGYGGRDGRR
ncbi:hypothetical protein H9P43_001973 [Blastocladiella emersonii ATCC 22665]|nr:hypothetical protein H9P43_001973 [Blastocladiella emersonii ATCC 22665]